MRKLQQPTSQIQEVLFELLQRLYIDRKTMIVSCGVHNLTARISNLRAKGVKIISVPIKVKNKFDRTVVFYQYRLADKKHAIDIYERMILNS
jgi:hypothetical protein